MSRIRTVLLALATTICMTSALQAQEFATDRGSMILGGSAGVSSFKGGEPAVRSTSVHLYPSVQYFVSRGLALGGSAGLFHHRYGDDTTTSYGVGPTASYFFAGGEQTLLPYLSGGFAYSGSGSGNYNETNWGAAAGVVYMLRRSVGLDASLFYRSQVTGLAVGFTAFAF